VSKFKPGQRVIYNKARSESGQSQDYPAVYIGPCEPWGNGFKPHKIECVIGGVHKERYVAEGSLRAVEEPTETEALKAALREALEWNWLDETSHPPRDVIERIYKALGEPIPPELLSDEDQLK